MEILLLMRYNFNVYWEILQMMLKHLLKILSNRTKISLFHILIKIKMFVRKNCLRSDSLILDQDLKGNKMRRKKKEGLNHKREEEEQK